MINSDIRGSDPFYIHEALHTAHILICTWDEFVANAAMMDSHPEIMKAAEEVTEKMAAVYQLIGAIDFDQTWLDEYIEGSE